MKWLPLALALSLSQIGCSDPFGDAQRLNTVEAYEQFIKKMVSPLASSKRLLLNA